MSTSSRKVTPVPKSDPKLDPKLIVTKVTKQFVKEPRNAQFDVNMDFEVHSTYKEWKLFEGKVGNN